MGGSQYGNEDYRTLITYKESLDSTQSDPADPPTWTGKWRDPRFSPPGDGGQPENALTGQLWMVNCCSYADQCRLRTRICGFWRNTAVAHLQSGQTYTMPDETLGYEWDRTCRQRVPAGRRDRHVQDDAKTSRSCCSTPNRDIGPGHACNSMTLYRAASGALVFDAGHRPMGVGARLQSRRGHPTPTDPAMQQATVNLLADMGAQPATLESGPDGATASTDTHAADLDDHLTLGRRHVHQRQHGHGQRHRHRLRRRRGRWCRGVHRRRLDLASGDHHVGCQRQRDLELHLVGGRHRRR